MATDEDKKVFVEDEKLTIKDYETEEEDIVSYFENLEEGTDLEEALEKVLKLGVIASKSSQVGSQVDYIQNKINVIQNKIDEADLLNSLLLDTNDNDEYFQKIYFKNKIKEGAKIKKGKIIAVIEGNAKSIFKAERVALNFLGLASGVATKTCLFVSAVKGSKCKICCTRKTLPNLRLLQKYAVKLGGGLNHRFNLSDEYLIKDNHIASSKNIRKIILKAIKKRSKKITVEVDKINQLKTVMGLKFHRILFDNMNTKKLRLAVKLAKKYYETEASGGVTHKNIKKIASTGVSRISVGEITHSAPTIDLKLQI